MNHVIAYIEENRERFVSDLLDLLRIPSVSADPARGEDMIRCARRVAAFFEAHVKRTASAAVEVEVRKRGGAIPVSLSADSPLVRAAERAVAKGFGRKPYYIRSGGTIPVVGEFKKALGLEVLLLGFGLESDRCHSPNEKFSLVSFHKGILTSAYLIEELTGTAKRKPSVP